MLLVRHRSYLLRLAIGIEANLLYLVVGTIDDISSPSTISYASAATGVMSSGVSTVPWLTSALTIGINLDCTP
jgi:hypothetical protein